MITKITLISTLILSILAGCHKDSEWTDLRGTGTACFLAIFHEEASPKAITDFLENHTQGPPHPGGGFSLREGINAVIKRGVEGQIAYEICFASNTELAKKAIFLQEVQKSPLVERVLEGEEIDKLLLR